MLTSVSLTTASAEISAGIAVVDITPPAGGHSEGYAPKETTDGVHDPITARVLVLKSDQTSIAIVVWDLCVFNSPWLHHQLAELGIDQLLLLNTHTHAGPNLDEAEFPSKTDPVRTTVEHKVFEAIKEAKKNMFPALFAAGEGSIQLGYNRLVRQPEGYSLTHFDNPERIPYGPVDPTVSVLRVTDAQGAVRAVLVNYACHAVVLGPDNRKLSSDYPGVLRKEVESKLGGNAVCFFIQGAAGDINPLILARSANRMEDFSQVETMGKLLAGEALTVLDRMKSMPGKADQLLTASKILIVENRWRPTEAMKVGVTTLLLNSDIGIIAMPGEPFHQFQVDWRRESGVLHPFFFGYSCNSADPWAGYMPDIESAARGGYGASDGTEVAVGMGERLLNQGLTQLYTLQGRLRATPQRNLNQ
jgi:hypothetical protein